MTQEGKIGNLTGQQWAEICLLGMATHRTAHFWHNVQERSERNGFVQTEAEQFPQDM